jgi:hypothetical protein
VSVRSRTHWRTFSVPASHPPHRPPPLPPPTATCTTSLATHSQQQRSLFSSLVRHVPRVGAPGAGAGRLVASLPLHHLLCCLMCRSLLGHRRSPRRVHRWCIVRRVRPTRALGGRGSSRSRRLPPPSRCKGLCCAGCPPEAQAVEHCCCGARNTPACSSSSGHHHQLRRVRAPATGRGTGDGGPCCYCCCSAIRRASSCRRYPQRASSGAGGGRLRRL